ncbi:MAG: hypothetical protein AAGC70_17495 [Pseudomonadota bacterium]
MTDSMSLLCSLLAYAGREIATQQFASVSELKPFVDAGWLLPVRRPEVVLCEVCGDAHMADLEQIDREIRGICRRTGETFSVSDIASRYRVDCDAFARALAQALQLDGNARKLRGIDGVWTLGARRLNETRIVFFFTPDLDRFDRAATILEAVAKQSRAASSCLIVANDIDKVRLARQDTSVVRLQEVAAITSNGNVAINEDDLPAALFPASSTHSSRGRPAHQRDRILEVLNDMDRQGVTIDESNKTCAVVTDLFKTRWEGLKPPAVNTVRAAISIWIDHRRGR